MALPAGSLALLPQKLSCDLRAVSEQPSPVPSHLPRRPPGSPAPAIHPPHGCWAQMRPSASCGALIIPSSALEGGLVTSRRQNEAHENADSAVTRQPGPRTCAGTLRTPARWLGRDLAKRRLSPCSRCLPRTPTTPTTPVSAQENPVHPPATQARPGR